MGISLRLMLIRKYKGDKETLLSGKKLYATGNAEISVHMQGNFKNQIWVACCQLMITIVNGLSRKRKGYHSKDLE